MKCWSRTCRAAISAISATLLVAVAGGCGSGGGPARVTAAESLAHAFSESPAGQQLTGKKHGGTLTAYTSEDFINFDPGQAFFILDYAVVYATQRPLFSYVPNSGSTIAPDMAAFLP